MIHAVLCLNNRGVPRLESFYGQPAPSQAARVRIRESVSERLRRRWKWIGKRKRSGPNFLFCPHLPSLPPQSKLLFVCFATLVVVVVCSENESELGTLDLINTLVKAWDV